MAEKSRPAAIEGQTQANENTELTVYEVGYHLLPTLSEQEVASAVERVTALLESIGGSILLQEAPKKIQFTYRIERSVSGKREKYTEGYFGFIKFEVSSEEISTLEKTLRETSEVLRFLLIKTLREQIAPARLAVFSSDRLEGETIQKPLSAEEKGGEVSDEEIDKSLEALVS